MAFILILGVAAGMISPGCEAAPPQGPGRRPQALALSPQSELSLGKQAYQEVLKQYRRRPDSDPAVRKVREVGGNIERAAAIEPLQREINLRLKGYLFEWEYNVLENNQVNAFCMPGGKVAVFTGLLPVVETNGQIDGDLLATVLAHEIAHALAHHSSERIARQQKYQTALEALNGALGGMEPEKRKQLIGVLSAGAQVGSLPYERQQEAEADHIGLFLMTFAGYDPNAAVKLWERMRERSSQGGQLPEILSDHPSDGHRIAKLKRWVSSAQNALAAYKAGRIAPPR